MATAIEIPNEELTDIGKDPLGGQYQTSRY